MNPQKTFESTESPTGRVAPPAICRRHHHPALHGLLAVIAMWGWSEGARSAPVADEALAGVTVQDLKSERAAEPCFSWSALAPEQLGKFDPALRASWTGWWRITSGCPDMSVFVTFNQPRTYSMRQQIESLPASPNERPVSIERADGGSALSIRLSGRQIPELAALPFVATIAEPDRRSDSRMQTAEERFFWGDLPRAYWPRIGDDLKRYLDTWRTNGISGELTVLAYTAGTPTPAMLDRMERLDPSRLYIDAKDMGAVLNIAASVLPELAALDFITRIERVSQPHVPLPAKPIQLRTPAQAEARKQMLMASHSLVAIAPGSFQMGNPEISPLDPAALRDIERDSARRAASDQEGAARKYAKDMRKLEQERQRKSSRDKPVHTVMLPAFRMMAHEVTYAMWAECVADGACTKLSGSMQGRDAYAAAGVSWDAAQAYIHWLNQQTDGHFRLPSEAEWEYAARAGSSTRYHWGDHIDCAQARYGSHASVCGRATDDRQTVPVKRYRANAFGLYDMHGNAAEWVEDCWHPSYQGAPADGSAWIDSGDCGQRVVRGGGWSSRPDALGSASRSRQETRIVSNSTGLRLVYAPAAVQPATTAAQPRMPDTQQRVGACYSWGDWPQAQRQKMHVSLKAALSRFREPDCRPDHSLTLQVEVDAPDSLKKLGAEVSGNIATFTLLVARLSELLALESVRLVRAGNAQAPAVQQPARPQPSPIRPDLEREQGNASTVRQAIRGYEGSNHIFSMRLTVDRPLDDDIALEDSLLNPFDRNYP